MYLFWRQIAKICTRRKNQLYGISKRINNHILYKLKFQQGSIFGSISKPLQFANNTAPSSIMCLEYYYQKSDLSKILYSIFKVKMLNFTLAKFLFINGNRANFASSLDKTCHMILEEKILKQSIYQYLSKNLPCIFTFTSNGDLSLWLRCANIYIMIYIYELCSATQSNSIHIYQYGYIHSIQNHMPLTESIPKHVHASSHAFRNKI